LKNEIVNGKSNEYTLRILEHSNFEQEKTAEKYKIKPERLASLDFQRGLAIWMMTFLHSFEHLYDYNWVKENPEKVLELPIPVLIVGLFVGFFACWNAYFLLISSTVNSLAMTKKIAQKRIQANRMLFKQLLTGFGILIVAYLAACFGYGGYFGESVREGWQPADVIYRKMFSMTTLHIIGWSMIINGIIHYFLMRKDGHEKYKRNMIIYSVLALCIIVTSPFIHSWIDNMPWKIPENPPLDLRDSTTWPNEYFQGYNASFKAWIMVLLGGDMEPLFPYFATSLIGSMIGLTLARDKSVKRFPLIGGLTSLGIMGLGGMFIGLGLFTPSNGRPAMGNYLLMLGGQIGMIMLMLGLIEYRGKSDIFANRKIVKHFRLWGMISLSVYSLQILEILPKWILSILITYLFVPINLLQHSIFGYTEEFKAILISIYIISFFELMISLWSKINFKYSFEWCIINLASLGSKSKSQRLDVQLILNEVHWTNYKQILLANKISKTVDAETTERLVFQTMKIK